MVKKETIRLGLNIASTLTLTMLLTGFVAIMTNYLDMNPEWEVCIFWEILIFFTAIKFSFPKFQK